MSIETIKNIKSCIKVVDSLFSPTRKHDFNKFKPIYQKNALEPVSIPLMTEDDICQSFLSIDYSKSIKLDLIKPYWNNNVIYNPYQIFYTTIQFTEDHDEPLAETVLPPQKDVDKYLKLVTTSHKRLHLLDQWDLLLNITNRNVVGAANLGFVASRLMARAYDRNMYPNLLINETMMIEWSQSLLRFEKYSFSEKNDGPGDTYYFWTHMFAAIIYNIINDPSSKFFDKIFQYGSPIMFYVRDKIVKQPIVCDHREASLIGRNVGLAIANIIKQ